MRVIDTVSANYNIGDFIDGGNGGDDYGYDASGNLTRDLNKGISGVAYTHHNRPLSVVFSNGNRIDYVYDAGGGKIKERVYTAAGAATATTHYLGGAVYKDGLLRYLSTPEGRTVYKPANNGYEEEYFVKDHLGNVRSVVAVESVPFTREYLATYEVASANLEGLLFDNVDAIREPRPLAEPGDDHAGKLTGDPNPVGTSIVLKVMAGDRIKLQADNYYTGYEQGQDKPISPEALLSKLVGALTGVGGGVPGGEGGGGVKVVKALFSSENFATFGLLTAGSLSETAPKAALNYVLYDDKMQVVKAFAGSLQVNGKEEWRRLETGELEIPVNGFLAVYQSNRSNTAVYFDRFAVRITRGVLREEAHYYPYGLPMGYLGSAAAGSVPNRQRYQGNEHITEAGLGWMSFGFRQYDPQLGRFLSVDPLAEAFGQDRWSPYAAMGNQPESTVDPEGLAVAANWGSLMGWINANKGKDASLARTGNNIFAEEDPGMMVGQLILSVFERMVSDKTELEGKGNESPDAGPVSNTQTDMWDGDGKKSKEPEPYPASGLYLLGSYIYDLNSFVNFYEKYSKSYIARTISGPDKEKVDINKVGYVLVNGKKQKIYSEVGAYLSINSNYISVLPNISFNLGTTFSATSTDPSLYMYSYNKSVLRIHIHPFSPNDRISISGYFDYQVKGGPSGNPYRYGSGDYANVSSLTNQFLRFVVVDATNIYLYNSNPNETITIRRK